MMIERLIAGSIPVPLALVVQVTAGRPISVSRRPWM